MNKKINLTSENLYDYFKLSDITSDLTDLYEIPEELVVYDGKELYSDWKTRIAEMWLEAWKTYEGIEDSKADEEEPQAPKEYTISALRRELIRRSTFDNFYKTGITIYEHLGKSGCLRYVIHKDNIDTSSDTPAMAEWRAKKERVAKTMVNELNKLNLKPVGQDDMDLEYYRSMEQIIFEASSMLCAGWVDAITDIARGTY